MSEEKNIPQAPKSKGFKATRVWIVVGIIVVVVAGLLTTVMVKISNRQASEDAVSSTSRLLTEPTGQSTDNIIRSMNAEQQYGSLVDEPKQAPQKAQKKQAEKLPEPEQVAPKKNAAEVDQDLQQALNSPTSAIRLTNTQIQPASGESRNVNGALQMMDKALNKMNHSQATGGQNKYDEQNMQGQNIAFLGNQKKSEEFQLSSGVEKPVSPYEIFTGSIIPATLQTGILSDLPGQIVAKVNRNVFDTVTGNYLLIPQGTTAVGVYSSQIAYGQDRVLFAWKRLVFPNGNTLNLEGMPGADLSGYSGLSDIVNNHYWKMFSSVLLLSIFSAGAQLSQPQQGGLNNTLTNQQILFAAVGQNLTQAGAQMIQKDLNIQPTIEIRPGANFNILVTRDMVFPGPYRY